jgi:Rod binding domain-containing protein
MTSMMHLLSATTPSSATAGASAAAPATAEPTPEQKKAARDFEAIFIRQLLSPLEKSSGLTGGESSGGSVFRSMMVGALADGAAEGGGIGMSELILKAMLPPAPHGSPELAAEEPSSQMGALHQSGLRMGSSRLGVAGRVLTEARSVSISRERHPTWAALPHWEQEGR